MDIGASWRIFFVNVENLWRRKQLVCPEPHGVVYVDCAEKKLPRPPASVQLGIRGSSRLVM
jgi:hypothetical protein